MRALSAVAQTNIICEDDSYMYATSTTHSILNSMLDAPRSEFPVVQSSRLWEEIGIN